MGKASSSKKVARAARAAGRPGTGRNLLWPAVIGSVVVAGIVLIVVSRGRTGDSLPPKLGDHWHAAYAIYDCDHFLTPLNDVVPDESGLHTHSDGLMHMHPFGTAYTGDGANIGNWGETVGLQLTDDSFAAGEIERTTGDDCEGTGPGTVQVKVWDSPSDEEGRLLEGDFADYAPQDLEMFVIAFVPEGTEIPKPPDDVIANLRAPADVVGASSTIPTATTQLTIPPDATSTTAPGGATESTTTTAATSASTTTTSPPATTTTSSP